MAFFQVKFFSNTLGMNTSMNVILPQQNTKQIGTKENSKRDKYPTVYLLHGMSDDESIWMRRTSIERYASEYGFAIVMPTTNLGWYTNTSYGLNYWNFISEELPKVCREFFPSMSQSREETFVAGLSMGGYGSFKLGLAKSDIFGAAASLSGALNIASSSGIERFKENRVFWEGIFGPLEKIKNSNNDLFYLADELINLNKEKPRFYLWCGEEDFLYQNSLDMEKKMKDLGLSIEAHYSKGNHDWFFWDSEIQNVLRWFDKLR
jgi:putative tributyrin esterase